ncbi:MULTISPECIES: hypothetical protein [Candidatus Nitrosocaldus]|jgi:hypothetical protein|uniref:Uncharacterized protein n=1 Tax=Candidatus Nitrosocaldus cavascurensis TaxID=2058097 RepID=A0A2K5APH1_9ARCH|nr:MULTISPECIES: hypothetical protein [Candidatus Nitrosocaldus]SPC33530.1 conserved protein of unknown function [Candidatus Nitrosocaldus cavascurensis]
MVELRAKSVAVLIPLEKVTSCLLELGFVLEKDALVVSDGRFWRKMLFIRGSECVSVSEEIGDAYPRDPVISMYASDDTIGRIREVLKLGSI